MLVIKSKKKHLGRILSIFMALTLLIGMLSFLLACGGSESSGNVLKNSTFEGSTGNYQVPDDWKYEIIQESVEGFITYGTTSDSSGNYFYIQHGERAYSELTQVVEVERNTIYQVSFEYRILNSHLQDSSINREPQLGLNPGLNLGVLQDDSIIANPTTASTGEKWSIFLAHINSADYKKLTLAIRLGIPLSGGSEIISNLVTGSVHLKNVTMKKYFSSTSAKVYSVGSKDSNLLKNSDFARRDTDGYLIKDGNNPQGAFSSNVPSNWKFESANGTTTIREGLWVQNGLKVNYFQMACANDTAYIYQKIKVEPNTSYLVSFYYYIPSTVDSDLEDPVDQSIKHLGGRLYQSENPYYIGLHAAVLNDPMYSGKANETVDHTTNNNYSSTPWRFYYAYINTNSFSEIDFAVRVGDIMSNISGIVRVSGVNIRKTDADESKVTVHYLSGYSGYASNKLEGVFGFILGLISIILLSIVGICIISVRKQMSSKKSNQRAGNAVAKTKENSSESPTIQKDELINEETEAASVQKDESIIEGTDTASIQSDIEADKKPTKAIKTKTLLRIVSKKVSNATDANKTTVKTVLLKIVSHPLFIVGMMTLLGFLIRSVLAISIRGNREDINLYVLLISNLLDNRLTAVELSGFTNPPLYLYVLEAIGVFKNALSLHETNIWFIFMLKLPNILADLVIGITIFFATRKFATQKLAYVLSGCILLNPAAIVSSSIWGEFDSFAIMFAVLAIYFLLEKKLFLVVLLYTLSALTKTSMHMIALPLIAYFVVTIFLSLRNISLLRQDNKMRRGALLSKSISPVWKLPLYGLIALVLVYLLSLRYFQNEISADFFYPLTQFFFKNAMSQTLFADNAFNMFMLLGRNKPLIFEGTALIIVLNIVFAVSILLLSITLYLHRKNRANLLLVCCVSIALIFSFMVNMNPRYLLLILPLLLLSFATIKDKRLLLCFILYSVLIYCNMMAVMLEGVYLNNIPDRLLNLTQNKLYGGSEMISGVWAIIGSLFNLALVLYLAYTCFDIIRNNRRETIIPMNSYKQFGKIILNFVKPKSRKKETKEQR